MTEQTGTVGKPSHVNAYDLARHWVERQAADVDTGDADLRDEVKVLAVMAALTGWLHRQLPAQLQSALESGASPAEVAAARGLSVSATAAEWRRWAVQQANLWQVTSAGDGPPQGLDQVTYSLMETAWQAAEGQERRHSPER